MNIPLKDFRIIKSFLKSMLKTLTLIRSFGLFLNYSIFAIGIGLSLKPDFSVNDSFKNHSSKGVNEKLKLPSNGEFSNVRKKHSTPKIGITFLFK